MTAISQSKKIVSEQNAPVDFSSFIRSAREILPGFAVEAARTDAPDSFPVETFEKIADRGLLTAVIPENLGGAGLGTKAGTTRELFTLLKILGYGNLVAARIYEGHYNAWQLIGEYGGTPFAEKLAGEARRHHHLLGVWNTEAGDGVKISPDEAGGYSLAGAKTFASGAGVVKRPLVTGKDAGGGWQMFVVPMDEVETAVDDSWWKPLGMQSSRSYRVDFSGVEIPAENLIGAADDYYRQPFFGGGAMRFAAAQLGAAEFLADLTVGFLRELNRTNDPFQQMRLGEMAAAIEAGNLWLREAARIFDEFLLKREEAAMTARVIHYAGIMRTAIENICQQVMIGCERSIGSRGLLKPYHFERVIRDLKTYLRQAAPDAALAGAGHFALQTGLPLARLWRDDE